GIRDRTVTGVQTCALPILEAERSLTLIVCAVGIVVDTPARCVDRRRDGYVCGSDRRLAQGSLLGASRHTHAQLEDPHSEGCAWQIGRASCRERVEIAVVYG